MNKFHHFIRHVRKLQHLPTVLKFSFFLSLFFKITYFIFTLHNRGIIYHRNIHLLRLVFPMINPQSRVFLPDGEPPSNKLDYVVILFQ